MAEQNTITIQFGAKGDRDVIDAIDKLDQSTKKLIDTQAKLTNTGKSRIKQMTSSQKAMTVLNTKLKALGLSFQKAGISTSLLTKAYQGNRIAIERVRQATNKFIATGEQASKGTRILGGTFAVLRSKALLAGFAIATMIRPILNVVKSSAKVESMSLAFNNLSGGAGNAEISLKKLKDATDGTMSSFTLFQQANNAMILGVTTNSDEMAEMFDIAQRLGRALGRDTASSVESLITGIGRQSRLMLDNIGIIVDSKKAYEDYAKANNLSADSLTDAQKKQAFFNATIESAKNKVKTLGDESLTSQDALDRMSASFSNLSVAIGQNLGLFTRMGIAIAKFSDKIAENISTERTLTNIQDEINEKLSLRKQFLGDEITVMQEGGQVAQGIAEMNIKKIDEELSALYRERDIKTELQLRDKERLENSKKAIQKAKEERQEKTKLAEQEKKQAEKQKDIIQSIANANEKIFKNNLEFQFLQIELQAKRFEQLKLENEQLINQADIVKFVEDAKFEAVSSNLERTSALYNSFEAGYDTFINSLTDMEMTGAERRKQIFESTKNAFIGFLGEMLKEKIKQIIVEQVISKTAKATSIVEAQATGALIAQAYAVPAFLASTASFGSASVAGLTSLTAGVAGTKALATFEEGGLIGGRRHSQGGTIIEAEKGEFVMSRNAVQSIGVETLNQMNQNGVTGSTVNVTIQGGVVDDSYVNNTLIPALNKATSLGNKINA